MRATISSGTVDLNSIGANTSALSYAFPSGITVASGATLAVGPNVPVFIDGGQTLTDDGMVSFDSGDTVTFNVNSSCCTSYSSQSIQVNGDLTADDTNFKDTNGDGSSSLVVNSGGDLSLASSIYSLNDLNLNSGSTASMTVVSLSAIFNINADANLGTANAPTVTGNDFSSVPTTGIVPSGNSAGTIQLGGNYWGTTVPSQIEAKIDNYGNPSFPAVNFVPYISNTTGIAASPAPVTFNSTNSQQIVLTATVTTSPTSQVIDVGTVTFTIFYGTVQIGSSTTPEQVSNGSATCDLYPAGR